MPPSINCKGKLVDLSSPIVMGILNATPDSFYNQGRENSAAALRETALQMIADGAKILDLGGMSSRPGAEEIELEEEWKRIRAPLEAIIQAAPDVLISIDTYRSEIAERALGAGAAIINDISGGTADEKIIDVCIRYSAPYICMHMQGKPKSMQEQPQYDEVVSEVYSYLFNKVREYSKKGLTDIIIDPGFGFGKNLEHNYRLLAELNFFTHSEAPLLVGISRKSMVYKVLGTSAENALEGTTSLHRSVLANGANILRVHDVKEAVECINEMNSTAN